MSSKYIGGLHFIEKFMNSEGCCSILKGNMMSSLKCLRRRSVFLYDNDLKHSTKKKTRCFEETKVKSTQFI